MRRAPKKPLQRCLAFNGDNRRPCYGSAFDIVVGRRQRDSHSRNFILHDLKEHIEMLGRQPMNAQAPASKFPQEACRRTLMAIGSSVPRLSARLTTHVRDARKDPLPVQRTLCSCTTLISRSGLPLDDSCQSIK